MTSKANEKILTQVVNRTTARVSANDADGLLAIIAACEQGREIALQALASVAPEQTPESIMAKQQERYEAHLKAEMEKSERSTLYQEIMDQGGIRPSSPDLAEEYRNIPNSYRRPDGLTGDVMAEHLASAMPELGITSENELLEYFSSRTINDRNRRVAA